MWKISYAVAAVASLCPEFDDAQPSAAYRAVQVAIKDMARSITGVKRTYHVRIPDLLHQAGLPSINEIATSAVAIESWKAYHSTDGGGWEINIIGKIIFSPTTSTLNVNRAG